MEGHVIRYEYDILICDTAQSDWLTLLDRRLNQKGQEGWQLVTVSHSLSRVLAFIMREKS